MTTKDPYVGADMANIGRVISKKEGELANSPYNEEGNSFTLKIPSMDF